MRGVADPSAIGKSKAHKSNNAHYYDNPRECYRGRGEGKVNCLRGNGEHKFQRLCRQLSGILPGTQKIWYQM